MKTRRQETEYGTQIAKNRIVFCSGYFLLFFDFMYLILTPDF